MDVMRRSFRVKKLEILGNEEIRRKMKMENKVTEVIDKRRFKYYGHVKRMGH